MPLGGLALQDIVGKIDQEGREDRRARRLSEIPYLDDGDGRTFYAIGGTWRALARLHMWQTGYPLHVMHGYIIAAKRGARVFAAWSIGSTPKTLSQIEVVTGGRRPLLAYAALVLEKSWCASRGRTRSSISALGVREGLLYSLLGRREREKRPAVPRPRAISTCCARARRSHGEELIALDRPVHGLVGPGRNARRSGGCATPPVCWPTSAGAPIRIIAASSR